MNYSSKYAVVLLNLLVAIAISAIVNFSSLLGLLVDNQQEASTPPKTRIVTSDEEGVLSVTPNGHGYLIYPSGDSVYVQLTRIKRLSLKDGDRLVADHIRPRKNKGGYPTMATIKLRNGRVFDYTQIMNRHPSTMTNVSVQLGFYLLLSFLLITLLISAQKHYSQWRFMRATVWCILLSVVFYFLTPIYNWRLERIMPNILTNRWIDYPLIMKCSFTAVVSILYGWIYLLISQRQAIVVENERLKNENLTTRYNMLVGQINPHFLFNSLNSLAMLIREKEEDKALDYIDQLSYTFRYILQNGQNTLITLEEEMKFMEAYCYLLKIRYADKLFFRQEISKEYLHWQLPALSLQPLIGNAVKHNALTKSHPMTVSIYTKDNWLIISNPKIEKLTSSPSTGIGLENLSNRWRLITHQEIEIIDGDHEFVVRLPLQNPEKK